MTKITIFLIVVALVLVGTFYYVLSRNGGLPVQLSPSSYTTTQTAPTPVPSSQSSIENEINSIDVATDSSADSDLTALDQDIKGL